MQVIMSQKVNKIIDRLKKGLAIKTDSALAKHLGVKPNTISAWKSRDSINYDLIFAKCDDLRKDWLLTGEGEMFNSNAAEKKAENRRPAPVQLVFEEGIPYKGVRDQHRGMIAIGSRMTPDKIEEGDFLVIDVELDPEQGDYVLRKAQDAPEIVRYNSGDPVPIGVVVKLVRTYR